LPTGWVGKPHACHQLALEAKGDWLLFTDADTVHTPQVLGGALAHAVENDLSLVSGWPHQQCVSPLQRTVIPVFIFMILSLMPLWWLHGQRRPRLALTVGQFVFIRRRDYWEIGGHEAVKDRILEDMYLGSNAVRYGKRQEALDLSNMVSTRMYQGAGDLWEGFTKWVYSIACMSPLGLALLMAVAVSVFVAPFAWLAWHFVPLQAPFDPEPSGLIMAQVAIVLLMRSMVDRQFNNPRWYAFTHPLGIAFLALSCLYAFVRKVTGAGIAWKGRVYEAGTEQAEPAPDRAQPRL
jgi:chlorobactene glucosyltransferase